MKKILLIVALSLFLAGCGEAIAPVTTPSPTATLAPVPTATPVPIATRARAPVPTATTAPIQTPTPAPITPTVMPPQHEGPIPSAAELSLLFSAHDGRVTDVYVSHPNGITGVGLDIQVYNPTQTRVKHLNYLLMQYFFGGRTDVSIVNVDFHANGYTGLDDPIASCDGVTSEYRGGYDEPQLWDAMYGVFNANLPA